VNTIGVDEIVTLIREAGFAPIQRTTTYETIRRW
jgi:2-iminoacetate synthase ThiH